MPSNPASRSIDVEPGQRIAGWQVLEASGPEASAFLQRQTMNDVAALQSPGQLQWNGLLNAKGRLQALFLLVRIDIEAFWLVTTDLPAAELRELLQRFVFRSKLRLGVVETAVARALWSPQGAASSWNESVVRQTPGRQIDIALPAESGQRRLLIAEEPEPEAVDIDADQRWRLDDLRCGLPRLPAAQFEQWTPHMLSLDRLAAFSLKKGCYPGQEIIARTHYLGRSKRALLRIDADSPIPLDAAVVDDSGTAVGNTICNASSNGLHSALLVAALNWQSGVQLACHGIPLRTAAFCGGEQALAG